MHLEFISLFHFLLETSFWANLTVICCWLPSHVEPEKFKVNIWASFCGISEARGASRDDMNTCSKRQHSLYYGICLLNFNVQAEISQMNTFVLCLKWLLFISSFWRQTLLFKFSWLTAVVCCGRNTEIWSKKEQHLSEFTWWWWWYLGVLTHCCIADVTKRS